MCIRNFKALLDVKCLMIWKSNILYLVDVLKNCASDVTKWKESVKCHTVLAKGKKEWWWICFNALKSLSLNLTTCNKHDFDRTSLLHSLDVLRYDGDNGILGRRVVLEQITFAVMQWSCKLIIFMCCHHRRSREIDIYVLLMASGRGSTVNLLL
jgi:hypothetical protein